MQQVTGSNNGQVSLCIALFSLYQQGADFSHSERGREARNHINSTTTAVRQVAVPGQGEALELFSKGNRGQAGVFCKKPDEIGIVFIIQAIGDLFHGHFGMG